MIPSEVENRIARYFFHIYLPEEVMMKVEDKLLSSYIWMEEENVDHDELVNWAIEIIDKKLKDKRFR